LAPELIDRHHRQTAWSRIDLGRRRQLRNEGAGGNLVRDDEPEPDKLN
jgi:hypothetical protein